MYTCAARPFEESEAPSPLAGRIVVAKTSLCAHMCECVRGCVCHAVPCRAVPCRAGPCRAGPCRAVPCRAVPCRAVPCRAGPCHAGRAGPSRAVRKYFAARCGPCTHVWTHASLHACVCAGTAHFSSTRLLSTAAPGNRAAICGESKPCCSSLRRERSPRRGDSWRRLCMRECMRSCVHTCTACACSHKETNFCIRRWRACRAAHKERSSPWLRLACRCHFSLTQHQADLAWRTHDACQKRC